MGINKKYWRPSHNYIKYPLENDIDFYNMSNQTLCAINGYNNHEECFNIKTFYVHDTFGEHQDILLFVGEIEELGWVFFACDMYANNSNILTYSICGKDKSKAYLDFQDYKQDTKLFSKDYYESAKKTNKRLESINKPTWRRWEVKSVYHSYGFFDGQDVDGSTITKLLYKIGLDNVDFKTVEKLISNAIKGKELEDIDEMTIPIGTTYDGTSVEVVGRVTYSAELIELVNDVGTVLIYFDVGDSSTKEQWSFGFKVEVQTEINTVIDTDLVEKFSGDKKMRKSIKERFDAPKDWDFDEMIEQYGSEYLGEHDPDSEPYPMDEFNELTSYQDDPIEAITRAFYGERYGHKGDSFCPVDELFSYNAYGNLVSIPDYYLDDYIKDHIDEEYFYEWCVDNGYFETEEGDE